MLLMFEPWSGRAQSSRNFR